MVDIQQSPAAPDSEQRNLAVADSAPPARTAGLVERRSVPVLVEPRLLTEADIFWTVWLGRKRYPKNYDPAGAEGWLRNIVLKNPLSFFAQRTENAFCVSMLSVKPWTPADPECSIAALCADDGALWEALKLVRCSFEWARNRKCVLWCLSSDTEYNFEMLARRIGADEVSPRFIIRL